MSNLSTVKAWLATICRNLRNRSKGVLLKRSRVETLEGGYGQAELWREQRLVIAGNKWVRVRACWVSGMCKLSPSRERALPNPATHNDGFVSSDRAGFEGRIASTLQQEHRAGNEKIVSTPLQYAQRLKIMMLSLRKEKVFHQMQTSSHKDSFLRDIFSLFVTGATGSVGACDGRCIIRPPPLRALLSHIL
jgi:hypothetical protein